MEHISKKIREIRTQQELTLKDLSEKTGLSVSFLSQVERGSSSLAITSLKKIADALGTTITSFFTEHSEQSFFVNKEAQEPFRLEGSNVDYVRLGGVFAGRMLEPLLVTLPSESKRTVTFNHPGEEFYYVLAGKVIFNVNGEEFTVGPGESLHFPSHLPHFWLNPWKEAAQILCVLTPVIF